MNACISLFSSGNGKTSPNFLYKMFYGNIKTFINLETLFMRNDYVRDSLPVGILCQSGDGATLPLGNPSIFPKFSNSYSLICDIDVAGLSVLYGNKVHRTFEKEKKKKLFPYTQVQKPELKFFLAFYMTFLDI